MGSCMRCKTYRTFYPHRRIGYTNCMLIFRQRTLRDVVCAKVSGIKPGVWAHAESPNEEEHAQLVTEGGFDEDLLKDAVDFYEAPRFEMKNDIAYFFTRVPHRGDFEVITTPLLIAISGNMVLTLSRTHLPFLEQVVSNETVFTTQKSKLFLILMAKVVASYQQHLTQIRRASRLGLSSMEEISNKTILEFVSHERTLNEFVDALVPTNRALETMLSGKYLELHEKDAELVEDLSLAMEQLIRSAQSTLKSMQNIRSAYATIVANNLNQVMKFLAALTVVLTIPMVVSSFYGMNVPLPFAERPLAFFAILGGTFTCVLAVVAVFFKRDWI